MGVFASLFGCGQKSVKLEEITSRTDMEEGFQDVFLAIVNDSKTDSTHIYVVKGLYKNEEVGLQIEVESNMENGITPEGEVNSKGGFVHNAVKISSIGEDSDRFVKALAELYEFPTTKTFTKQPVTAVAFSLNQRVADLEKPGYYKFKLFPDVDNEELYAEIFLNINTEEKIIELHEKDEEYRQPLIEIFTKQ